MKTSTYIKLGIFEVIGSILIILLSWNNTNTIRFFSIFLTVALGFEVFASGYYRTKHDALKNNEE